MKPQATICLVFLLWKNDWSFCDSKTNPASALSGVVINILCSFAAGVPSSVWIIEQAVERAHTHTHTLTHTHRLQCESLNRQKRAHTVFIYWCHNNKRKWEVCARGLIWPQTTRFSSLWARDGKVRRLRPSDRYLCNWNDLFPSEMKQINKLRLIGLFSAVKSSHLYLYSAFNNTNCDKATAQYQNRKIVSIM